MYFFFFFINPKVGLQRRFYTIFRPIVRVFLEFLKRVHTLSRNFSTITIQVFRGLSSLLSYCCHIPSNIVLPMRLFWMSQLRHVEPFSSVSRPERVGFFLPVHVGIRPRNNNNNILLLYRRYRTVGTLLFTD